MNSIKVRVIHLGSFQALVAGLLLLGCNSITPVEYDNPHDPLSGKYVPHITAPPFNFRFVSVADSGFTISWQDTNTMLFVQRVQSHFLLEKSVNDGPFFELARLGESTTSFFDNNSIDTTDVYKYKIKLVSPYDTSLCPTVLIAQYTAVDAEIARTLSLDSGVGSLTLSRDGTMLGASGVLGHLRVWHIGDYNLLMDYQIPSYFANIGFPYSVSFSLDNKMIAMPKQVPDTASVNVWRLSDRSLINEVFKTKYHAILSACFSGDGSKIICGYYNGLLNVCDIDSNYLISSIQAYSSVNPQNVNFLYPSRDGKRTFVGGYGGLQIWRNDDWTMINQYDGLVSIYYTISFDEQYITYGGSIRSLETGTLIQSFDGYSGKSMLTYDNRFLIGQQDGALYVGQVSDGTIRFTKSFSLSVDTYPAIACLPNCYEFFAAGDSYGVINLWTLKFGWTNRQD